MPKVISADNFARDYQDEYLMAENLDDWHAEHLARELNDRFCNYDEAPRHYVVKPDTHVVYKFEGW